MRPNHRLEKRGLLVYVVAIASITIAIVLSVSLEDDDDRRFNGCSPQPPTHDEVYLDLGDVMQFDVDRWCTNVTICANFELSSLGYTTEGATIEITDSKRQILTEAEWTYYDRDDDGIVSVLDVIEITNMTREYQGSLLMLNGRWGTLISWDVERFSIYMVHFHFVEYSESDDGLWDIYFIVDRVRGETALELSQLTIAIQEDENSILTSADVRINDTDRNGVLSEDDRIEISNMTERYRMAVVRLITDDIQIGYSIIPNFR